jgi:hypothetical protein
MGTQLIANFEQQGVGIRFNTVTEPFFYKPGESFTFAWCCYMLLIDAAIYGIIGWYIHNVFPGWFLKRYNVLVFCGHDFQELTVSHSPGISR